MKWISVKERLPENNTECLVRIKWQNVSGQWITDTMLWDFNGDTWGAEEDEVVTHRMPLPKPPRLL